MQTATNDDEALMTTHRECLELENTLQFTTHYNFCAELQNSELLKSDDALGLNELLSRYNRTLASLLDKHAPLRCRVVPCRPRMPWFTAEIGHEKRKRR